MWTSTRGEGSGSCGRMWTDGGGQKSDLFVDVINGWPHRLKQRFSTCGSRATGPGHLPGGRKTTLTTKTTLFCKDTSIQRDQFWQFSMAQFSLVVRDQETIICKWFSSLKKLRTTGLKDVRIEWGRVWPFYGTFHGSRMLCGP